MEPGHGPGPCPFFLNGKILVAEQEANHPPPYLALGTGFMLHSDEIPHRRSSSSSFSSLSAVMV